MFVIASAGLPIAEIAEQYLSGMFAEVRMMANYFRPKMNPRRHSG
jgi:hypothetical protein